MNLHEKLEEYGRSDYYPFHMPGHKRNRDIVTAGNPYAIDITEIDGFDNLHEPEGIIQEEMERARRLFGAEETYFCINGSSGGLLAAISACTCHGDEILVARNCHKSVYNALTINELQSYYLYPQFEDKQGITLGILPEDVDNFLKTHQFIKIVVIVSPTYEGIVSNIKRIAEIVHKHRAVLIVDEAHGAHFSFHKELPVSAVELGADIVIQSIHKTLPAFTQTALVHVQGERVNKERLRYFLSVYQSTSPSYMLMAGISRCLALLEEEGKYLFDQYIKNLREFYKKAEGLQQIIVEGEPQGWQKDPSKIVISVKNTPMTGRQLYDILLHRYHLQMEMTQDTYVLAMTSICDTREGFQRLLQALKEIDHGLAAGEVGADSGQLYGRELLAKKRKGILTLYEASLKKREKILLEEAAGRIAGDYVYLYPPGIPLLCPGEEIDRDFIELILYYRKRGLGVHGILEEGQPCIFVAL